MKIFAQVILSIFFIIFCVFTLIAGTARFAFLNYAFWTNVFLHNNVYQNLSASIKNTVNNQVGREGGSKGDVAVLTDLITTENTRDFVNNNLNNFIDFANGKAGELIVYIPINKAPKDLLPKNIALMNNEMTVTQLSERFNIVGLSDLPLKEISSTGPVIMYVFVGAVTALVLTAIFIILATEGGSRFVALGISFLVSGFIVFAVSQSVGAGVISLSSGAPTDLNSAVIKTVFPPMMKEIINWWMYVSFALMVLGALLFFFKKPNI